MSVNLVPRSLLDLNVQMQWKQAEERSCWLILSLVASPVSLVHSS